MKQTIYYISMKTYKFNSQAPSPSSSVKLFVPPFSNLETNTDIYLNSDPIVPLIEPEDQCAGGVSRTAMPHRRYESPIFTPNSEGIRSFMPYALEPLFVQGSIPRIQ